MDSTTNTNTTSAPKRPHKPNISASTPETRFKQSRKWLCMAAVGVTLTLGALNLLKGQNSFSEMENRNLAQRSFPTLATLADSSYFANFTASYADQFLGRNALVALHSLINLAEGTPQSGGVYIGKEGHLFQIDHSENSDNQKETFEAIAKFAEKYPQIKYYCLIIPNAQSIQAAYLPNLAPKTSQLAAIDAFEKGLPKQVKALNSVATLQNHAKDYIYYKTDHHWTSEGAKYVFEANFESLTGKHQDDMAQYQQYTLSHSFQGTLTSKSGYPFAHDTVHVYESKKPIDYLVSLPLEKKQSTSIFKLKDLDHKDQYTVFFGGNHPLVDIKTTVQNDKTILILKDSYANCFVQFLLPYYERIIMVDPRYYTDNLKSLIDSSNITDVLYLYSGDIILNDTNLASVLHTTFAGAKK